jgi:DNA-binding IclR family transcriptional regulator
LARARLTFEDDVIGTAAPVFGQSGAAIGSLAIASVSLRMTTKLQKKIDEKLKEAAVATTKEIGGIAPRFTKPLQMEDR